jgi:hypothetical protein
MTITEQRKILCPREDCWDDLFSAEILDDGNLKIIATEKGQEEIRQHFTEPNKSQFPVSQGTKYLDEYILMDIGMELIAPVEIGALTSAPIVCLDGCKDYDEGKLSIDGPVWWHERYQVESICEVLAEKGEIVLPAAEEIKP